jgi:hypothetical protein
MLKISTTDDHKAFLVDREKKIEALDAHRVHEEIGMVWTRLVALLASGVLTWGPAVDSAEFRAHTEFRALHTPEGAAAALHVVARDLHPSNLRKRARALAEIKSARASIEADRDAKSRES